MMYLGLRSSPAYLERLARIRSLVEPHCTVSVIGGLAFLHALNPRCRRLILSDIDPDAEAHARLVLALIDASRSAAEFLQLLSGYRVLPSWPDGEAFAEEIDARSLLERANLSPELSQLYARTYGAIRFDRRSGVGSLGRFVVRLFGDHDLKPDTYAWHFRNGCFASERTFAELKEALDRTQLSFASTPLEAIDYRDTIAADTSHLVVLASNCESPLFTRGDAILRRVQDTVATSARYVSWTRDLVVSRDQDGFRSDDSSASFEMPLPEKGELLHVMDLSGSPELRSLLDSTARKVVRFRSIRALRSEMPYGHDCFLCALADGQAAAQGRFLRELHAAVVPLFRRILIVARSEAAALERNLTDALYDRSYALHVESRGAGRSVARLTLRGAS